MLLCKPSKPKSRLYTLFSIREFENIFQPIFKLILMSPILIDFVGRKTTNALNILTAFSANTLKPESKFIPPQFCVIFNFIVRAYQYVVQSPKNHLEEKENLP